MLWGDASADSSPPITARGNIPPAPFLEEHSQDTKAYEKEPSLVAMAELTNAYLANATHLRLSGTGSRICMIFYQLFIFCL